MRPLTLFLAGAAATLAAAPALAQTSDGVWVAFGSEHGDALSSVLLHEIFGPLFPSASGSSGATVFSTIIGVVNVLFLIVGGLMFFYNVTVGVLQTAHEGEVLGKHWSSLWAPLRVLFAVGLLVPVPGLGGYNLAQGGVAYLVRGATSAATMVWTTAAGAVISSDIPLAASAPMISPSLVRDLYYNAACMEVVQYQVDIASGFDGNQSLSRPIIQYTITHDGSASGRPGQPLIQQNGTLTTQPVPTGRISAISALTGPGERDARLLGICGSWSTPDIPVYLSDLGEGGDAVRQAFATGHAALVQSVVLDMRALAARHFAAALAGTDIPDLSPDIAAATRRANGDLSLLVARLRTSAIAASGADDGRDLLLSRIRGSSNCSGPDCLGEGWLGAGTWYITMARLNNRLSSVVEATPNTTGPELTYDRSRLFEEAGGRPSGRRFLGLGSLQVTEADIADMPNIEEVTRVLEAYHQSFVESAASLAALGYPLAASSVAEINRDVSDSIWDYVPGAQDLLTRLHQLVLSTLEPGNFGADPMIGLNAMGKGLIVATFILIGAVTVAGFVTGGGLAVALAPLIGLMMLAGITLAFVLPVMPFLYWLLGVTGYFLTVVEAVVAINLWALAHMRMDGDGISGAAGRRGWLLLLTITFTPVLMILGFIAGMVIFRVSEGLISAGFFYAVEGVVGGDFSFGFLAIVGYVVLLSGIYVILLERSFSLITEFPQRVLRWIGETDQVASSTFLIAPVRPGSPGGAGRALPGQGGANAPTLRKPRGDQGADGDGG